ncbi:MAG TPA: energy transducer TonB [Burkholderiales bacterium]
MAAKHEPTSPDDSPADASHRTGKVRDIQDYRVALDTTLPPTPLKDLLAAGGATVYVLSADDKLHDVVRRAGGGQFPVEAVRDWAELRAAIDAGRCHIALLDAELLGTSLVRHLDELERCADRLVTLVAATRSDSEQLIAALSGRKIHRLLIKPPSLGITRLLLESAVARWLQLREQAASAPAVADEGRRRARAGTASGRLPTWLLATGVVSLLLGVLLAFGLTRSLWQDEPERGTPAAGAASPPVRTEEVRAPAIAASAVLPVAEGDGNAARAGTPPVAGDSAQAASPAGTAAAPPDRFVDLLQRAELAFAEGRLAEPPGDNALDYYLTILTVDPQHERARAQLQTVVNALFAQVESALLANSLDEAAAALEHVRRAEPSSARLVFLETQLQRSREAASGTADASSAGRAAAELDSLLTLAQARLERGQLIAPAGDSAREYWTRAAALNANDERVLAVRAELVAAVIASAGTAARNGNVQQAEALRAAAAELDAPAQSLADIDRAIAAARARVVADRHASLLEQGRTRLASGALLTPENDSALYYLATLRAENAEYPGLDAAWSELEATLESNARAAFTTGDYAAAQTWLDGLAEVAPTSPALRVLATEVAAARRQQEYLSTAVPASVLPLLRYRPPQYPPDAQRDNVEGWVTLEFIVGLDGRPRDIVVAESEPPGRFEAAAIEAVEDYVYAPYELDGRMYERRVRLRLTFDLR